MKTLTANKPMQVRIKKNAYVFVGNYSFNNSSEKLRKFLKANEGKLIEIDSEFLFNDQYNTTSFIDENGVLNSGFRIFDSMICEVINDKREGKGKCKYCGSMLNAGEICVKHTECLNYGIAWFTPKNTFFLKYPNGINQPEEKKEIDKIGSYTLENIPTLDYFRISNSRKTINFKYKDGLFYVESIGWNQKKNLDIPLSAQTKLIKVLNSEFNIA